MIAAEDFTLPESFVKTIDHFVPGFWRALASVKDFRHPLMIAYPMEMELLVALLMFVTKLGSRRAWGKLRPLSPNLQTLKCSV